jgi:hypothetical protein
MKLTFAPKTFSAQSFRSATWAGPAVLSRFRLVRAALFVAGAVTGQHYHTGATAGKTHG